MQTFLPYSDFEKSAKVLDYRRLGKQRVEAFQILNVLENKTNKIGWKNHPAVKMWRGFEDALKQYQRIMILEWIRRGYKNNMKIPEENKNFKIPFWINNEEFHASHRSNLKRKDSIYYAQFTEPNDLPYIWPVQLAGLV